jgi:hypothetical protein
MSDHDSIERLKVEKRRVLLELTSPNLSPEKRNQLKAQRDFIQEQIDPLKGSVTSAPNLPELRVQGFVHEIS